MEKEIMELWNKGLTKNKVAEIYRTRHNQNIKLVRSEMHNRHSGRLISSNEALSIVERVIYKNIMKERG